MRIEQQYIQRARELHRICPVVDTHLDLAGELRIRVDNGEVNPLREHYLQPLRACGVNLLVSSVFLEDSMLPEAGLRLAMDQISVLMDQIEKNEEFIPVRNIRELEGALEQDKIGIMLYMEGLDCIGSDLRLLRILWELGVRGASLTWSRRNALASGCCKANEEFNIGGGLSREGILAVQEMERLGMFVDVSHLNDDGFEDICRITRAPFIATHSNSRSIHFNYRNLTDDQIRRLAAQGGILGLNGCRCIVGASRDDGISGQPMENKDIPGTSCSSKVYEAAPETLRGYEEYGAIWETPRGREGYGAGLEMLCRHVEYEVKLAGADKVGYGFDFCDSYDRANGEDSHNDVLVDHSHVPELTAALLQRGMAEEDVKNIIGGNFIRYFRNMLPVE